jgi:predicted GTPase
MKRSWLWGGIAIAIVLIGLLVWYLLSRKGIAAAPGTTAPATQSDADKAAKTAADALAKAQQAETNAQLQAKSQALIDMENRLAQLEKQAILDPTKSSAAAAQQEAVNQKARAELEASWRSALTTAETQMNIATSAAQTAVNAYNSAISVLPIYRDSLARTEAYLAELQQMSATYIASPGIHPNRTEINQMLADTADSINRKQNALSQAQADVLNTRTSAESAVTSANLCIERAESIAADLRLLGILIAEANRIDAIASATRTKVGQLESQISALKTS